MRDRVRAVLERTGRHTPEREIAIMALLDDETPNPLPRMADLGFLWSAGSPNQRLLRRIEEELGRARIDREGRDSVLAPLRELNILGIGTADPDNNRVISDYWVPKSNYCLYRVRDDFRALIIDTPNDEFEAALGRWLAESEQRRERVLAAETRALAENAGERLVPLTIETYCAAALPDYEVVYVDDADLRDTNEWAPNIERYDLPLNLATRWPDIVLRHRDTGAFWFVDCVENDGEVDVLRRDEIVQAFTARGHTVDGFTTAYRTLTKFAQRQRAENNLAAGTYVWIMEIGGAHFLKESIAQ